MDEETNNTMEAAFFFFFFNELRQRVEKEMHSTGLSVSELSHEVSGGSPCEVDVFISYSYRDDPVFPLALFLLLRDENCKPYLPRRFSREKGCTPTLKSVENIQNVLSASKSLILLDGPLTTRSQWIPWEIGYVAGRTGKVATFIAVKDQRDRRHIEFLNLYPNLAREENHLIVKLDQGGTPIGDWINREFTL